MNFKEQLNDYIQQLECNAKDLADASGLSASVISRYRTGNRTPDINTSTLDQLVMGIVSLAEQKGLDALTKPTVSEALNQSLKQQLFPYETFQHNFNELLTVLDVNVASLSHHLAYDASYISRIRNGQRRPTHPENFAENIAKYVVCHSSVADREILATLLNCDKTELTNDSICVEKLVQWLTSGEIPQQDLVFPFLTKLDEFDLNEFIRSIHFDELKVPTVPLQLHKSQNYYGLEDMCKGTLDFFKTVVLSKSKEALIMNDDTPMADKASGNDFMKKYIFAVALTLKKGLHINFIHNINRPFEEIMMGLEGWIPLYMTGQVSPYYLKGIHNTLFGHFLYSSDVAALSGECIMGHHENAKMYLTNHKTEVAYYRKRAENILEYASPLMEIYRSESKDLYQTFCAKDAATHGQRRSILSSLPLYTISQDLLSRILEHNSVSESDKSKILEYAAAQSQQMEQILTRDMLTAEIPLMTEQEFSQHPMLLPLSGIFYETDISYTFEEYQEHLELIKNYAENHKNYSIKFNSQYAFRNIQIQILEDKWTVISKSKSPAIHFVVRNPQLRGALENMVLPVFEKE